MTWRVRFVDFPAQFDAMEAEIIARIRDVLRRGDLILRQQLRDFEDRLAAFVGTRYAIGVSNCTEALRLTIHALGVGSGDEVLTVAHTFVATIAAIHHVGATPVLVDVGDDHNVDPDLVEPAITPRTKVILLVHLNGRLCDMGRLMDIASRGGLLVVEDAAQALGASYNGSKGGAFGVAGAFSFYPAKILGAYGDAGAIVTNDVELANRVRLLRDHGRATQNDVACWGFNARLDNLQAAILDLKLQYLPRWIERRRELAGLYHKALDGIGEVRRPPSPDASGPHYDVYQNYVIEADRRDELAGFLERNGVETMVSWPKPLHHHEPLGLSGFRLPRTEELSRRVLSLPLTTELEDEQIYHVADVIRKFYGA